MENLELHPSKVYALDNATFVEFMTKVNTDLQAFPVITTTLTVLTTEFAEVLIKLQESLVATRGNSYTARLGEADSLRDAAHAGFILYVNAYKKFPDATRQVAANNLYFAAKQYGLGELRRAPKAAETALLDSLMETITSVEHADDVAALPELPSWITAMADAIANYKAVEADKLGEANSKLDYTTEQVRKEITPIYNNIAHTCLGMANGKVDQEYIDFIHKLNTLIDNQ